MLVNYACISMKTLLQNDAVNGMQLKYGQLGQL